MSITKEEADSLREGDIVRLRHRNWGEGAYIEGPLHRFNDGGFTGGLFVGGLVLNGLAGEDGWTFEVVRLRPRFYANVDREDPVVGDVAHTKDSAASVERRTSRFGPWFYTGAGWISELGRPIDGHMPKEGNVLLVDGTTRTVVPVVTAEVNGELTWR